MEDSSYSSFCLAENYPTTQCPAILPHLCWFLIQTREANLLSFSSDHRRYKLLGKESIWIMQREIDTSNMLPPHDKTSWWWATLLLARLWHNHRQRTIRNRRWNRKTLSIRPCIQLSCIRSGANDSSTMLQMHRKRVAIILRISNSMKKAVAIAGKKTRWVRMQDPFRIQRGPANSYKYKPWQVSK